MESNNLQILRSVFGGISQRKVAKLHRISRDTVSILVRYAHQQGWTKMEDLEDLKEEDLTSTLSKDGVLGKKRDQSYTLPDYEYVHQELGKENVTLTLLWEEYVEKCLQDGTRYYKETQFRRYYHQFAKSKKCTIRLEHKPGLSLQVDWAGSRIAYYDEDLGQASEAHLFVAVLPCSQLIYSEVFRDEKLPSWINGNIHSFRYFGGVPKSITPDNLKTGVQKPNFYEPSINRSYQEMAEYYGTVILPARIRKPQDKAAVENSVKIASQRILGKLRNHPFHSFFELQEAVAKALEKINSAPLTGKNMSRWDAFLAEEKDYLLTLPTEDFELSEWTVAKVQPNSHIAYQNHFYSVPFEHLEETVDVRATQNTVEIFYHHQRIASHKRVWGSKQYSTIQDHMPPGKMFFVDWDADRFISWSKQIGPSCQKVIQRVLDQAIVEQQAYRSCFGILGLKDKYSAKRLEAACSLFTQNNVSPSYSHIKRALERGEDLQKNEEPEKRQEAKGFRRGADYYKK